MNEKMKAIIAQMGKAAKDPAKLAALQRRLDHETKLFVGETVSSDDSNGPETEVDSTLFSGNETLQSQGIYILAFDIGGPMKSSKGFQGFHTTKGGMFQGSSKDSTVPYGSFKITQIFKDGKWERVKYGAELDEVFGGEQIGGLFVRITNDFSEFATEVWEAASEAHEDKQRIQIQVKVVVPPVRGAIIRSEHRGKAQYNYRVAMMDELHIVRFGEPGWLVCDDAHDIVDTRRIWADLPTIGGDPVAITPANQRNYVVAARERAQSAEAAQQAMRKSASDVGRASLPTQQRPGGSIEVDLSGTVIDSNSQFINDDDDDEI